MKSIEKEKTLTEILKSISKVDGYTCYIYSSAQWEGETHSDSLWGYITTPSNNILYIEFGFGGGWKFSLTYKPSRGNGSGCQCLTNAVDLVTIETVQQAEIEGIRFASTFRPRPVFYKSFEEFRKGYFKSEKLVQIT